ncbi:MAG: transporter suffix domain-containing protein [Deltaproteobacteria bacterium]|nr:transporter suffix domain-containing protein [Deltaproteobacteria bacterium]
MMTPETTLPTPPPPGWRFYLGVALFLLGFLSPLGIPLVTLMDLPLTWKATLSGILLVGVPEVFCLLAVAFLGKSGFIYIKAKIYGFFRKYALPKEVSRRRYRLGLVMFIIPLFCGWLGAYVFHLIPGYAEHRFAVNFAGDVIWLSSLVVLGSYFWDKVRALFIYRAKALIPQGGGS